MTCIGALPLLLSALTGVLLGLVIWGFFRARGHLPGDPFGRSRDDWLFGLLVLAAFASGAFSALVLLMFEGR
jgi:hypothetical protein